MSVISHNQLAGAAGQGGAAGYQVDRSLRFHTGDSSHLSKTFSSAGNRKTWTWSCWFKRTVLGTKNQRFFSCLTGSNDNTYLELRSFDDDTICLSGYATNFRITDAEIRDPSAWYHLVVACDTTQSSNSDRVKLYLNGVQQTFKTETTITQNADLGFNQAQAHKIGDAFNGYLADIYFVDGMQLAASDFGEYDDNNVWQPKKYSGTYGTNGFRLNFSDNSSDAALGTDTSGNSNTWTNNNLAATTVSSMPVYGAWTGYAGAQWSSSDTWDSLSDASSNFGNNGGTKGYSNTTETWTGTKTSWTGAFGASNRGSNGWALKFPSSVSITVNPSATSSIVACASTSTAISAGTSYTSFPATMTGQVFWFQGGGYPSVDLFNSVAAPNSAITDSFIDSPSNYISDSGNNGGNYATLNILNKNIVGSATLTDGNLKLSASTFGHYVDSRSTIAASSFDCYCEMDVTEKGGAGLVGFGIGDSTSRISSGTGSYIAIRENGQIRSYPGNNLEGTVNSFTTGDVIGIAVSLSQVKFYKNGSLEGTFSHSLTGDFFVTAMAYHNGNNSVIDLNFGQRDFQISSVPTGYKSLCSTNFPDPTIADGSTAMDVALYTGDGNSGQTVSGLNFSPDFVWFKSRSESRNHAAFDTVRGVEKRLQLNITQIEDDSPTGITAFNSDGFTFGSNNVNGRNGVNYVAWAWDAGSSNTSNSVGSLNSSVYSYDNWTSMVTGNYSSAHGWGTTYQTLNAFDGNLSTMVIPHGTDGWKFEPTNAIAGNTIEIYGWNDGCPNAGLKINGNNYGDALGANQTVGQWYTLPYSTLSSIEMAGDGSPGSSEFRLIAIRIDGKILIQNGQSPPNVPSIATTVRANASTGFSIASWTGTGSAGTISHGLNAAPEFIIVKNRDTARPWSVFHQSITNMSSGYLNLNLTNAFTGSYTGVWNGSDPTTGVFSVGTDNEVNNNGDDFIAYCWTSVSQYSSFGSYVGNGSSDGPFLYTGFRPKWIMFKNISSSGDEWMIYDSTRDQSNSVNVSLEANTSDSESTSGFDIDFLSNGFKPRTSNVRVNGSSTDYIYAAFGDPFKTARAR